MVFIAVYEQTNNACGFGSQIDVLGCLESFYMIVYGFTTKAFTLILKEIVWSDRYFYNSGRQQ